MLPVVAQMDLRQGSRTLSCSSLTRGLQWMEGQPQPTGVPPVKAFGSCMFKIPTLHHPLYVCFMWNNFDFKYAHLFFWRLFG